MYTAWMKICRQFDLYERCRHGGRLPVHLQSWPQFEDWLCKTYFDSRGPEYGLAQHMGMALLEPNIIGDSGTLTPDYTGSSGKIFRVHHHRHSDNLCIKVWQVRTPAEGQKEHRLQEIASRSMNSAQGFADVPHVQWGFSFELPATPGVHYYAMLMAHIGGSVSHRIAASIIA